MKNLIEWVATEVGITEDDAKSSLENIFNKAIVNPKHDLAMDNCNLCRIEDLLTNYHSYFIAELDKEKQ